MKKKSNFFYKLNYLNIIIFLLLPIAGCNSTDSQTKDKIDAAEKILPIISNIQLTFSGDIMAHDVNFNMKDYNRIYDGVREMLTNDDLTFGNIEMPVCNELPLSSFPSFNVHEDYLKAAADGGFDVFAFANNHTNDKGIRGIDGTITSFSNLKTVYEAAGRQIFSSGLKQSLSDNFEACVIEKNGWKILFLSVTELLNSYGASKDRLYYSPPTKAGRKKLMETITDMRKKNPCDIFILALHLYEPEYGLKVLKEKREWFKSLAASGVDIIWAHHPHVLQEWEIVEIENEKQELKDVLTVEDEAQPPKPAHTKKAVFMYSMGNFISGQRWVVNYANPAYYMEYTGDSALMQVCITKTDGIISGYSLKPVLITNYNESGAPVIKLFTKEWAESLPEKEKNYYLKRLELMKAYLAPNL